MNAMTKLKVPYAGAANDMPADVAVPRKRTNAEIRVEQIAIQKAMLAEFQAKQRAAEEARKPAPAPGSLEVTFFRPQQVGTILKPKTP